MTKLSFLVWIFFLFSLPAWAEDVVPDARVQDGVSIRSQPDASSSFLGLLRPGMRLPLEGSVPRWYRVRLPNGSVGFVSKAWAHVVGEQEPAQYKMHAVDVGTGLAVIVEGQDFLLVYDGGSNDDLARGQNNRLLSYLKLIRPTLTTIDHIVLSHPHRDHVELLPDLFDAYQVKNVWDSGRPFTNCGYRRFLAKTAVEPGAAYHDAVGNFGTRNASFAAQMCYGQSLQAETLSVPRSSRITEAPIELGASARMSFLHADAAPHSNPNENSLVVNLELGATRILFMGDAEAGGRADPSNAPLSSSIEGILLACCAAELRADILVVGHHGSMTSSRAIFLNAIGAKVFVVSGGPTKYGSVTLPDQIVVNELESRGQVFRTDLHDDTCSTAPSKVGTDNDGEAGGCDNILIEIGEEGATVGYSPSTD